MEKNKTNETVNFRVKKVCNGYIIYVVTADKIDTWVVNGSIESLLDKVEYLITKYHDCLSD